MEPTTGYVQTSDHSGSWACGHTHVCVQTNSQQPVKAVKCPVCVGDGQPIITNSACCQGKGWIVIPEAQQPEPVYYFPYWRVDPPNWTYPYTITVSGTVGNEWQNVTVMN